MAHAYTEDQLVEQPALGLFAELNWQTIAAMEEVFGANGTLGRETPGEVVLVPRLGAALVKLNPALLPEAITSDITHVMGGIGNLLDASIIGVDMPAKPAPAMDLSRTDFEALRLRFKESKYRNTDLEILKATIRAMLERLMRLNKTRTDFSERFEELIASYNAGSRNIEELFQELLKLSCSLSEEQQRHVRENLTEDELVIFDILTRPAPELSPDERTEVMKVSRELLNRLKSLFVLNWRQKSAARAQLRLAIEDVLDTGLPCIYTRTSTSKSAPPSSNTCTKHIQSQASRCTRRRAEP